MPETTHPLPLYEWTILSLRPQGQHAAARLSAKQLGAQFVACSSLKLSTLANDVPLKNALACDHVIVTSPAAVRFAGNSAAFSFKSGTRWYVLGEGSAVLLKRLGVTNITIAQNGSDSEGLLSLPALNAIHGQSVGLITAPGGRGLIEPTLNERGAHLHIAFVYQRTPLALSAKHMQALRQMSLPFAVLCSSHEVFQSLWNQCDTSLRDKLKQGLWVLSSDRLQAILRADGLLNSTVAYSAQPKLMLEHLRTCAKATGAIACSNP